MAETSLSYEALRHAMRVTEEDMIEALGEAVASGFVTRLEGAPRRYEVEATLAADVRATLGEERAARLRHRVEAARGRVHEST